MKEIPINNLTSIDEVYELLEEKAFEFEKSHDIKNVWVKYRDQTKDISEKQAAQWELEAFLFNIRSDKPFAHSYSYSEELKDVREYPAPQNFQLQAFDYIETRTKSAKNPLLLARYNFILWNAPKVKREKKYAEDAIDNYIKLIDEYLIKAERDNEKEFYFQITIAYETLLAVGSKSKLKQNEIKAITRTLLKAHIVPFYVKHSILEEMLTYKNIFKKEDFAEALEIFRNEIIRNSYKTDGTLFVNSYLPTALRIASKLEVGPNEWQDHIGEYYTTMGDKEEKDDRYWIKQMHYMGALKAFRLSGNKERISAVEIKYAAAKEKSKLSKVSIRFTEDEIDILQRHQDSIKEAVNKLLKASPEVVYSFISSGTFFPRIEFVRKAMGANSEELTQFFTITRFDSNKNILAPEKSQEDDFDKLFQIYGQHIQQTVLPYLHNTFIQGIRSGKLTFRNLINYLNKFTWLGQNFSYTDMGGDLNNYNWVSLVAPSVIEFFVQVESAILSKAQIPNFVLCIDSLTLKMEGMIRDFGSKIGIPTAGNVEKGMQEKMMHKFLEHPEMKKHFNEDDQLFFKYLFGNESGLNMRNKVAHCFYYAENYTSEKMFLLLAALLRLAKYSFQEKSSSES